MYLELVHSDPSHLRIQESTSNCLEKLLTRLARRLLQGQGVRTTVENRVFSFKILLQAVHYRGILAKDLD